MQMRTDVLLNTLYVRKGRHSSGFLPVCDEIPLNDQSHLHLFFPHPHLAG